MGAGHVYMHTTIVARFPNENLSGLPIVLLHRYTDLAKLPFIQLADPVGHKRLRLESRHRCRQALIRWFAAQQFVGQCVG